MLKFQFVKITQLLFSDCQSCSAFKARWWPNIKRIWEKKLPFWRCKKKDGEYTCGLVDEVTVMSVSCFRLMVQLMSTLHLALQPCSQTWRTQKTGYVSININIHPWCYYFMKIIDAAVLVQSILVTQSFKQLSVWIQHVMGLHSIGAYS